MRLARIRTHNFRNLPSLDTALGRSVVIVGENRAGKSNLLQAIRLVLDSSLPYADRRLSSKDFWDGLDCPSGDPMVDGYEIRISLDLDELSDDKRMMATLGNGLVELKPPVARLTYKWAPDPKKDGIYTDGVYFADGEDNRRVPNDLRDEVFVAFTSALRDVESDIRSWRRSPLRSLLERVIGKIPPDEVARLRTLLSEANDQVVGLPDVEDLATTVERRVEAAVGPRHALGASLRTVPPQVDEVIRALTLYVDGSQARSLDTASLGSLNILYFVLLQLGSEARLEGKEVSHTLVMAEEPEAHLHPHLQRSVLEAIGAPTDSRSILVTTHSPQLVSAVDGRALLRLSRKDGGTVAHAAADATLTEREWGDVNRYLGATQAEMVFATKVLLVEGYAEEVLVPAFASEHGMDLNKEGITVCAIHGTHFLSYAKLCGSLGIPFAIVTDGDPRDGELQGRTRLSRLAEAMGLIGELDGHGLFLGEDTLEVDLYRTASNAERIHVALTELGTRNTPSRIETWKGSPSRKQLVDEIDHAGGKGRFAQRLASEPLTAPAAFQRALDFLRTAE
ncbi:AAA family ATPase [Microbacterium sp. NPDC077391]|uniref:ATP-dependent nuclease n=1 Tax=Microbacterium sp. NPDC077391 TaxID=3154765 RepID=UPI00343A0DBD